MINLVVENVAGRTPVRLAVLHANAATEAQQVLDAASEVMHPVEKILTSVSPVIGAHTGPGTVGLAFMAGL
jgi:fatty acid-binding protein DegV